MARPFIRFAIGLTCLARIALSQNDNPTGPAGAFNGYSTTAGEFDPYTANATRIVIDLTVPGAVGGYPLVWSRRMNSRHVAGPSYDFGEAGSWQHSYNWGIESTAVIQAQNARVVGADSPQPLSYTVYYPDGRVVQFTQRVSPTVDPMYRGPAGVADRFQPVASSGYCYLLLTDGSKVQFYQAASFDAESHYWTFDLYPVGMIDPHGLVTRLTFGGPQGQLTQVTEPGGRWLKMTYGAPVRAGLYVITTVQAGYGANTVTQSVTYSYSAFTAGAYTYTTLTGVTYSDGTAAAYTYQPANTYPNTGPPLIQTCNDVRHPGPMEKIAYEFAAQASEASGGIYGEFAIARHWLYPEPAAVNYWLGGHVETRGDGPQRTFFFGSNSSRPQYVVPQPYLLSQYTDFKGKSAYLGYEQNTYISDFEDANGNLTNFTRTFTGKPLTIVHPPDATGVRSTIQYSYTDGTSTNAVVTGTTSTTSPNSAYGYYLASVTDELGHTTVYQRDGKNQVKEIDYPDTGSETFTYTTLGDVLTHKMTSGGTESFEYDERGLRTSYRDPYHDPIGLTGKPTFWYQYDSLDRISGITDSRGIGPGDLNYTTNYAYNQRGQLTTTTHPTDAATGQRYTITNAYNPDSTLASTTDERGNTTTYAYDDYKRLTSTTAPPAFSGDTAPRTTSYYYDHTGGTALDYTHTNSNIWLTVTPLGNRLQTLYDQNFWKASITAGNGGEAATTTYTYDNVGNVHTAKDPNGQSSGAFTEYFYDARNRLTDVNDPISTDRNDLQHTISWTYDQVGNIKSQLRGNNQLITFDQYDPMNRLQAESIQRDTDVVDQIAMTYDSAGNLATYIDARQKTYAYAYDFLNRRTSVTYPKDDRGVATTERYVYGSDNNLDYYANRAGATETITYDNRNRPTQFSWNDGTESRSTSYDPVGNIVHTLPIADDFTYDFRNRLTSAKHTDSGLNVSRTVSYTYDADSNRQTMTYPSGLVLTYGYNSRNQLRTESDGVGVMITYDYDLSGNRVKRTLRNGTSSQYYPDALNRPQAIRHFRGGPEFARFDYRYDPVSRITSVERNGDRGDTFGYYLDDQLKTSLFNASNPSSASPSGAANSTSIAYDGNGNRTSFTNTAWAGYTYTANDVNEYTSVSGTVPSYSSNGNLSNYSGWSYEYNARNELTTAQNYAYAYNFYYNAFGRQVLRYDSGNWIYSVWDGPNLIEEYDQNSTLLHRYVHGAATDEMVQRTGGTQTIWYYQDGQGNTSHLTDDSGNLLESYLYPEGLSGYPCFFNGVGQALSASAYDNRFLQKGRDFLQRGGFYDYRNRFYLPNLGRFLQPDPLGFRGDQRNLYRSFHNDPVNGRDPLGLDDKKIANGDDNQNTPWGPSVVVTPDNARLIDPDQYFGTNNPWGIRSLDPATAQAIGGLSGWFNNGGYSLAPGEPPEFNIRSGVTNPGPTIGLPPLAPPPTVPSTALVRNLPIDVNTDPSRGDLLITHYGYPSDNYKDSNSNLYRLGNSNNLLDDNSLALTQPVADSYQLQLHDPVFINGQYLGHYDDTAPEKGFRIDIYDRYGVFPQNWGGVMKGGTYWIDNRPYP